MTFKDLIKKTKVSTSIIVICGLMFLVVNNYPNLSETESAILFGAYYKSLIVAGEFWRLLSCGFIHVSAMHLLVNMFALGNIGRFMEIQVGAKKYLTIIIVSIIGGSIFQFIVAGNSVAVGLSGGLYGLVAAYTYLLCVTGAIKDPVIKSNLIRIYLINLMINFMPGVAYSAHLGGYIFGVFVMAIMDKGMNKSLRTHFSIAFIITIALVSYLFVKATYIKENERYMRTDYVILSEYKKFHLDNYAYNLANKLDDMYDTDNLMYNALKEE